MNLIKKEAKQFKVNIGAAGFKRAVVLKAKDRSVVSDTGWTKNLLTNSGLDEYCDYSGSSFSLMVIAMLALATLRLLIQIQHWLAQSTKQTRRFLEPQQRGIIALMDTFTLPKDGSSRRGILMATI